MKNSVIEIIRDRLLNNPELNVEYLSVKKKMKEQDIIREILFEFLRFLPPDFDAQNTTVRDCMNLIDEFCKKHRLE